MSEKTNRLRSTETQKHRNTEIQKYPNQRTRGAHRGWGWAGPGIRSGG